MANRILLLAAIWGLGLNALTVTHPSGPSKKVVAESIEVPIYPELSVTLKDAGKASQFFLTGNGIRVKKKFIFKGDVYVAASYVDHKYTAPAVTELTVEKQLKKITESPQKALKLTFLRDVTFEQIESSFKESLGFNGVESDSESVKKFLGCFKNGLKKSETVTLVGLGNATPQKLFVESPSGTTEISGDGIVDEIWSIWFGRAADKELKDLQFELVGLNKHAVLSSGKVNSIKVP